MQTKAILTGALLAGAALGLAATARAACSTANLSGSYSTAFTGFIGASAPLNAEAFVTANGAGSLTGTMSVAEFGFIRRNFPVSGSYTLNASCVGAATLGGSPIGAVHFDFSLSRKGRSFAGVETDAGTSVAVNANKF